MTREEAIEVIQKFTGWFKSDSRIYEALEMAIQALSQEPQCTEHPCLGTLCRYYKEPCDECRNKRTSFCGNCKKYDEFEPQESEVKERSNAENNK